jgi:hypothetical protein
MRWRSGPRNLFRPGFAFWPLRDHDAGEWVWLERIWVRDDCMFMSWARWEERPNDTIVAEWRSSQVLAQASRDGDEDAK